MSGKVGKLPKVKSKTLKSNCSFKIEFSEEERIKLEDFKFILELLDKKSILFIKMMKILEILNEDEHFSNELKQLFPSKMNFNLEGEFSLQV